MDWSSFLGGLAGSVIGITLTVVVLLIFDNDGGRKEPLLAPARRLTLDDILEGHLEQLIVERFEDLFPGWRIYSPDSENDDLPHAGKSSGVRLRTPAGEIDMLCVDTDGRFVVIELKRNRAPDKVVAQTDRYIAWVTQNMAKPGQAVRGLIICKSFDRHLSYTLSRRHDLTLWTYDLQIRFDKEPKTTTFDTGESRFDQGAGEIGG